MRETRPVKNMRIWLLRAQQAGNFLKNWHFSPNFRKVQGQIIYFLSIHNRTANLFSSFQSRNICFKKVQVPPPPLQNQMVVPWLIENKILWVYYTISPLTLACFGTFEHTFSNYFVWLRITDQGSVPNIWSILLIKSDSKCCIHLSRSPFLYVSSVSPCVS